MTSLRALIGTEVVSRDSAEHVGDLQGVVVDIAAGTVTAWQVGKGRKARLVDHAHVTGVGDAMVIDDEASLRDPADHVEEQVVKGRGALLGSLVLGDDGTERGDVEDVDVEVASGALGIVSTASETVGPERLRGLGTYALVVAAS